MFCTQCGSRVQDADRFCAACGAAVAANHKGPLVVSPTNPASTKPRPSTQQRISAVKDAAAPLAKTTGIAALKWGARLIFFGGAMIVYLAWKEYTLNHGTEDAAVAAIRGIVVFGSILGFWKWTKSLDDPVVREFLFDRESLAKLGSTTVIAVVLAALLYNSDIHMTFKVALTLIGLPVVLIHGLVEGSRNDPQREERRQKKTTTVASRLVGTPIDSDSARKYGVRKSLAGTYLYKGKPVSTIEEVEEIVQQAKQAD